MKISSAGAGILPAQHGLEACTTRPDREVGVVGQVNLC